MFFDCSNGIVYMDDIEQAPEVAAEQTVETEAVEPHDMPVPVTMVEVRKRSRTRTLSGLKSSRTIIGPGSKV